MGALQSQLKQQGELLQMLVKGNGQGKGTSKGQGKPDVKTGGGGGAAAGGGKGKEKAKWACLRKGCSKSEAGALNNANRMQCFCCGVDKGACMSPPAALCRTTCQDTLKKEAEDLEAAKKVEQARPKAAAKPPKAEPAPVPSLPKAPALLSMDTYDKGRTVPPAVVTVKTAEECLLGVAPRDKAFELAQARDDVAYLTEQLHGARQGTAGSARLARVPNLQADLEKATANVDKLAAEAPTKAATGSVTLLQNAVTDYDHLCTTRQATWQRGAGTAVAAEEEAVEEIQAHILQWQTYLVALQKDAGARREAWVTHQAAATAAMAQVTVVLKERHTAAVTLVNPLVTTSMAVEPAVPASASVVAASPAAPPVSTVTNRILPMVDLPNPLKVDEDDLPTYALAMRVLEHHSIQEVDFPLTFAGVPLDHKIIAKMVGTQLWTDSYPADAPTPATFISRRVLGALKVAITRMAIAQEAVDKVEQTSVTDMVCKAGTIYDQWKVAQQGSAQY